MWNTLHSLITVRQMLNTENRDLSFTTQAWACLSLRQHALKQREDESTLQLYKERKMIKNKQKLLSMPTDKWRQILAMLPKVIKLNSTCVMPQLWDTAVPWTYLIMVIGQRWPAGGLSTEHPCRSVEAVTSSHYSEEKPEEQAQQWGCRNYNYHITVIYGIWQCAWKAL